MAYGLWDYSRKSASKVNADVFILKNLKCEFPLDDHQGKKAVKE